MKPNAIKQYSAHPEALQEQLDPNNSLAIMTRFVGENKRVLDVGCAGGYLARVLAAQHCEVVGVDINAEAVEAARTYCSEAFVADIEAVPLRAVLGDRRFDVVVCGDVLEHLLNPARVLEETRNLLTDEGYLVASFPNVAHGAVRLSLLSGRFDYQDEGLLDDTHVRFFTLKSIDEMLLGAGYRVDELMRSSIEVFEASPLLPHVDRSAFDEEIVQRVLSEPEAATLQFIVKAYPLSDSARHRAVFQRFSAANTELANARVLIEARDREVEQLRRRSSELAARSAKLEAETAKDLTLQIEHARLEERLRLTSAHLEELRDSYEKRIAALEASFAAQLEAEAAKTRAQADQIEAYIASGKKQTS